MFFVFVLKIRRELSTFLALVYRARKKYVGDRRSLSPKIICSSANELILGYETVACVVRDKDICFSSIAIFFEFCAYPQAFRKLARRHLMFS